jgi:hypothetical protein
LPQGSFPLTHEWVRYYDPKEMAEQVCQIREFLLCRHSLVSLVVICEAALLRLNEQLSKAGKCTPHTKNMRLLRWAFDIVKSSPVASKEAAARLPQTCGDLDHARRLRNCIVHRNGLFDEEMYFKQVIEDKWVAPQYLKDSRRATDAKEPIFLITPHFEDFSRSHLEFLHILHNTIQMKEFGCTEPYNYSKEGKKIEWFRVLSGRRDVGM